jgi:hypothetical protein
LRIACLTLEGTKMSVVSFSHSGHSRRLRIRWPVLAAFAATLLLLLISGTTAAPLLVKSGGDTGTAAPDSIDRRYFLIDPPLWRIETIPAPEARRTRLKHPGAPATSPTTAQVRPA